MSTLGGYHEYIGGYNEYIGGYHDTWNPCSLAISGDAGASKESREYS